MKCIRIAVLFLTVVAFAAAGNAEVRYKQFTKEEIKKMADTTAVIETKFGDITLRFFPNSFCYCFPW